MGASTGLFTYTYEINGKHAVPIGEGDLHEPAYDEMEVVMPLLLFREEIDKLTMATFEHDVDCLPEITFSMYPSKKFEESFYSNEATYYTTGVVVIFIFTTLVFMLYDFFVHKRQAKVMARIMKQNKIVSNIFPSAIVARLYGNDSNSDRSSRKGGRNHRHDHSSGGSTEGSLDGLENPDSHVDKILADLFPSATIIYLGKFPDTI